MIEQEKINYQAQILKNRLEKRYKHLRKWAKRNNITCYRIYDKDIPEIPLAIDFYQLEINTTEQYFIHIYLYERPYEKSFESEEIWLNSMCKIICEVFNIEENHIIKKYRKRQRGIEQYEKNIDEKKLEGIAFEQDLRFKINLSNYLDTGLFFDHRPLRKIVRESCAGKSVLNLFCYTGSFSVYAAAGGASSIDSVDLSNTYLDWAKENFKINGLENRKNDNFIRKDTFEFLAETNKKWDLIILDPPTFSNSKKMEGTLDINRDWHKLVSSCLSLLEQNGILYFSTNSRHLNFDENKIKVPSRAVLKITDITSQTIPEDFRNQKIHRCWKLEV